MVGPGASGVTVTYALRRRGGSCAPVADLIVPALHPSGRGRGREATQWIGGVSVASAPRSRDAAC